MATRRRSQPLDIRDVQTIKHDRTFMLCDRFGDVPQDNPNALGLYFRDTRFLARWELRLDGARPLYLHAQAERNYSMRIETTLPITRVDPAGMDKRENLAVSRHRWLESGMRETIRLQNFGATRRRIRVELLFGADFLDLFEVRGAERSRRGAALPPEIGESSVTLRYEGVEGVERRLEISFDPAPKRLTRDAARFEFTLAPQSSVTIEASLRPVVGDLAPAASSYADLESEYSAWRKECTRFRVDSDLFQRFLDRAVLDLRTMQTDLEGLPAIDAGVPWFSTLFGRDSLITAYETIGVRPELATGTLMALANRQGQQVDEWREEEPGKILHEIRCGEMAAAGEIPHTPYYGSIDATVLWLILYGHVWLWTADRAFAERLWPNVLRALEWIDRFGDADGDGYLEYQKRSEEGLDNQGWKDSRDGILFPDGTIPEPPIALCEVQGYVYDAKTRVAEVARALGHADLAGDLEEQARKLALRFNEDFWMPDQEYFAVALDGSKRQVGSITSNPGHCLWSRIVTPDKARLVARRLRAPDLACGWGIRTLSARNAAFDPIGYHTGSIWPHDNALIAHGLRRYGFDEDAHRVIDQLSLAGSYFRDARYPELYCGFSREDVPLPVEYPVACRPQAWATGAPLLMIRTYGGIFADAPNRILTVQRPSLPQWISRAEIIGLRVGDVRVDLAFTQSGGATAVQVLRRTGDLDVIVRY